MKRRPGAFSLIEVLVAIAIVSGLAITGILLMRGTQVKKQSKAAAEILAEGLRLANLKARSQGVPVAVGIPTDMGKTPVARGYYLVMGESAPAMKRGYDYGAELPDALLFAGKYAGPGWTPPLATVSRGSQFSFEDWFAPYPSDAYFVFLPSGEVVANHSAADGTYRIVVGTRMAFRAPVVSGDPLLPPESELTGVSDPYTIVITTQGQVEVVAGLVGGAGGLVGSSRSLPWPDRIAFTPTMYRGPNRPPVLVPPKLVIDPRPDRATIPVVAPVGDPAITMLPDGRVQLTFFAQDPDGDQLTASWSSECVSPPTGVGPGSWTTPTTRMRWSYLYHAWYRSSVWSPPPEALPNHRFVLRCNISDGRGGLLRPSASTAIGYPGATADGIDVTILPHLRLTYRTSGGSLQAINFDGSAATAILTAAQLGASNPSRMNWSSRRGGLLYLRGVQPRFLSGLDGRLSEGVGSDTNFDGTSVRGLTVADSKLYGLVENGTNWEIQAMPAPSVSGDLVVETPRGRVPDPGGPPPPPPVAIPKASGDFQGLIATHTGQTLISSDGAGKFLFVWLDSPTMSYAVLSGPSLSSVAIDPTDSRLYGVKPDGSIAVSALTLDEAAHTASMGAPTTKTPTGCAIPSLSPNGQFLMYKDGSGHANLLNLGTAESAVMDVLNYDEMVWSEE